MRTFMSDNLSYSVRWATGDDLSQIKDLQLASSLDGVSPEDQEAVKATEGYVSWLPSIEQLAKIADREGIVCAVTDTGEVIGYEVPAPFDIIVEEFAVFEEVRRLLADVVFEGNPVLEGFHIGQIAVKKGYKGGSADVANTMHRLLLDRVRGKYRHLFTGILKSNPRSTKKAMAAGFVPVASFDDWVSFACKID